MARRLKRWIALGAVLFCAGLWVGERPVEAIFAQDKLASALADWQANEYRGVPFVGSASCAECHEEKVSTYSASSMHDALELAADAEVLKANRKLTFRQDRFAYEVRREGSRSIYTVREGARSISAPIVYAFGRGVVGQTWVFKYKDKLYESRVSFYTKTGALDVTIGQPPAVPATLEAALGRPLPAAELQACFGCHAPRSVEGLRLEVERLTPGVSCESCHGPGESHVLAMKAGKYDDPKIFNPGQLHPLDLSQNYCGKCHMSFDQAMVLPDSGGDNNVRFQAYRLFRSRGHRGDDPRISCIACHDPHEPLRRDPEHYDAACLECHLGTPKELPTELRKAAACPKGTNNCAQCHMPEVELPGMHAGFRDHWIRIVEPGEPAPR